MEDCVVEVSVRIAAGSSSQKALPLFASQEGDVLYKMRHALLMWLLVHAPYSPMTAQELEPDEFYSWNMVSCTVGTR